MNLRLPFCLMGAVVAAAAMPAMATPIGADSEFRLLPPAQTENPDMARAVRHAVALNGVSKAAVPTKPRRARALPTAFDAMPDTNLNYSRSGGPAIELGVLGSEIGKPKGVVHFALDWDF